MPTEDDAPVVPLFQCSAPQSVSDYQRTVSSLYTGFMLATDYINDQV